MRVDAKGFRHRIVGKGIDQNVLPTAIAEDVRLIQLCLKIREKAVSGIGFAIAVGNAFGVGFAAEIALRRHYFHVFKLLKFRLIDLNLHFGHVADENGDGEQRQVGGGFFQHGGHFGHGDKALCKLHFLSN